jgi:AraC-like DNA-binding protein
MYIACQNVLADRFFGRFESAGLATIFRRCLKVAKYFLYGKEQSMRKALASGFFKKFWAHDKQLVSHNLDEVRFFLQRNSGPQKYELQGRKNPFLAKLEFKKLNDLTVSYGWFGPAMIVTTKPSEPFYSLFCRLSGSSEYTVGNRVFVTSPSCGAILPWMHPVSVRTTEQWHVFGTNFSPSAIRRELSCLLGREITHPVEFDPDVNFDSDPGRCVKRMCVQLYKNVAQHESELSKSAVGVRQMERSLITRVLEGVRHNYSKLVNAPGNKIAPRQVRIVEEFIRQYADEPLSLGDLAIVGGVSARSLQYTFLRYRGCSPMDFLRSTRFERVRHELLEANEDTTVTSVALRWGFSHLGRFAAEYRARFHESPSETLRRVQGPLGNAVGVGLADHDA